MRKDVLHCPRKNADGSSEESIWFAGLLRCLLPLYHRSGGHFADRPVNVEYAYTVWTRGQQACLFYFRPEMVGGKQVASGANLWSPVSCCRTFSRASKVGYRADSRSMWCMPYICEVLHMWIRSHPYYSQACVLWLEAGDREHKIFTTHWEWEHHIFPTHWKRGRSHLPYTLRQGTLNIPNSLRQGTSHLSYSLGHETWHFPCPLRQQT